LPAAGWGRALDEARGGEAKGKRRSEEERGLAARELRRGGHQLFEVLVAQHVRELLDLIGGRIDVFGDWPFILIAHLATSVMERGRYRVEGPGQTLLLHADLRRRLLTSRIDQLHGLVLRLANDLRSLTAHTGATTSSRAAAARPGRTTSGEVARASGRARPGPAGTRLLAACRFP